VGPRASLDRCGKSRPRWDSIPRPSSLWPVTIPTELPGPHNNNNNNNIIIIIITVKNFSDDIHMEFGLEKCTKITFKRGKLIQSQNLLTDINREIQELEQGKNVQVPRD
jgi:hypothetical protein